MARRSHTRCGERHQLALDRAAGGVAWLEREVDAANGTARSSVVAVRGGAAGRDIALVQQIVAVDRKTPALHGVVQSSVKERIARCLKGVCCIAPLRTLIAIPAPEAEASQDSAPHIVVRP